MAQEKRYNSDGEELFLTDKGIWLPKPISPTQEEIEKYYSRFEHPKINFYLVGMVVALLLFFFVGGILFLKEYLPVFYSLLILIGVYVILFIIFVNKLAIFAIRVYQYFAPMKIREKCVFTPTCSSYAIQAIKKYGIIKALPMIRDRIKRCHGKHRQDPLL